MSYTAVEALMLKDRAKAIELGIEPWLLAHIEEELTKSKRLKKKSKDAKRTPEDCHRDYTAAIEALRDAWRLLAAFIKAKGES